MQYKARMITQEQHSVYNYVGDRGVGVVCLSISICVEGVCELRNMHVSSLAGQPVSSGRPARLAF